MSEIIIDKTIKKEWSDETIENNKRILEIIAGETEEALRNIMSRKLEVLTPVNEDEWNIFETDIDLSGFRKYVSETLME